LLPRAGTLLEKLKLENKSGSSMEIKKSNAELRRTILRRAALLVGAVVVFIVARALIG
jgi:hypothetical protein